jgi:hypothetical protein
VTPPWIEVFAVLLVCHLVGDYLLQTEFQAVNKHGGLGRDPVRRRALALHTLAYTAAYIPALIWLSDGGLGVGELALVALAVGIPHGVQDDGRLLRAWMSQVKHTRFSPGPLSMAVDQSFHVVALFVLAVAVGQ